MELSSDPAILLQDIHPKDVNVGVGRDSCTRMFTAVLFTKPKGESKPRVH